MSRSRGRFLRRHAALPDDHGSWVFFLSPLIIGLAAGGRWRTVSTYLVVAAVAAFLARQPVTLLVKMWSGRRPTDSLPAAFLWLGLYAAIVAAHVTGLVLRGYGYLLWLAAPGFAVFAVHLWLIARREERRQRLVGVAATGVLALTAPAGLWVGLGYPATTGWLLWGLTWTQSAASVMHAYMRLEQRGLRPRGGRASTAALALAHTSLNLVATVVLAWTGVAPRWIFVPYAVQAAETVHGTVRTAVAQKPKHIGRRQLVVSLLFTLLFIAAWHL